MRIETWYDLMCDNCGSHISTDFGTGMFNDKKTLRNTAKQLGWKYIKDTQENICPKCMK